MNPAELTPKEGSDDRLANLQSQDLSYEDALLDRELRSYVKAEYGSVTAPRDTFYRLSARLERDEQPSRSRSLATASASPSRFMVALTSMQRYLARSPLPGVVSSALVLLLAFLAIDSRLSNLPDIANPYSPAPIHSRPASSPVASDSTDLLTPHSAGSQNKSRPPSNSAGRQPVLYDPTYDDPQTWTPETVNQSKYNIAEAGTTGYPPSAAPAGIDGPSYRSDVRRADPGPQ